MTPSTIWWVLAGGLVAVELLSGTFYLLMLAVGTAAAGLAAQFGATGTTQLVVAALVGGGAVVALRAYRQRRPSSPADPAHQDGNLDIGALVRVDAWSAEGTASVKYRGANWQATLMPGQPAKPGAQTIVEIAGNQLVVKPV